MIGSPEKKTKKISIPKNTTSGIYRPKRPKFDDFGNK